MSRNKAETTTPPSMCNTGGSIRHKIALSNTHEDTVNISLWFDNKQLTELFNRLEEAKKLAQKKLHKNEKIVMPNLSIDKEGVPYIIGEFQAPEEEEYNLPGVIDFGVTFPPRNSPNLELELDLFNGGNGYGSKTLLNRTDCKQTA